ncbi:MAG: hypothetical protein AAFY15_00110, partial [Cyanobacteria bacterium J06648_11]
PGFVFLGYQRNALYCPLASLGNHIYVTGAPGSGKTSRVLAPLLEQLISNGHPQATVDCKWDSVFAAHLKEASRVAGRRFHLFSLLRGVPSDCSFDFFASVGAVDLSPRELAEILMPSLGLEATENPFFRNQNLNAITEACRGMAATGGRFSFKSLAHHLREVLDSRSARFEHALQALDAVEQLADCPELDIKNPALPPINLSAMLRRSEVVYFCIPTSLGQKALGAAVAALLLKATVLASRRLELCGTSTKKLFLCIDEFQDVAGSADIKNLVAQVRGVGGGISMVLAHQTIEQVEDAGLAALLKQSGVVIHMTPASELAELQQRSGEYVQWQQSHSRVLVGEKNQWTMSDNQVMRPVLEQNDVLEVNATDGYGLTILRGSYPKPTFFPHHVALDEAMVRRRRLLEREVHAPPPVPHQAQRQKGSMRSSPQAARKTAPDGSAPRTLQPEVPKKAAQPSALERRFAQVLSRAAVAQLCGRPLIGRQKGRST